MGTSSDIKNTFIYIAQSVLTGLLTVFLYPVITKILDPSVYGVYILAMVYASVIVGIANMGCIVGYERNYFVVENSEQQIGRLLSTVQIFVGTSFAIVIMIGWISREWLSKALFDSLAYSRLWFYMLIAMCFSSLAQYYLTHLKNAGRALIYFTMTILQAVVNFVLVYILLIYTDLGVYSLVYAILISNVIMCLSLFTHQFINLTVGFEKALLSDVLKISIPLTPKVLFGFLNTQFDKIMLGMLSSIGNVAIYAIAQRIALFIFTFMTALDRVFKPNIYRMLFSQNNNSEISRYVLPFAYLALFPALIMILFSDELMSLLVASSYREGASVLVILSLYYALMFISKITSTQLIYAKKTWLTSKLMLVGVVLNILLNIPMIIYWGFIGAAIATTFSSAIMTYVHYHYAQKFAAITWEYKSMILLWVILLFSSMYAIFIEPFASFYNGIGELIFIILYLLAGYKIGVVSKKNYIIARKLIR